MKAIILPGNGNTQITENWYQSVSTELRKLGIDVIAENMPDPYFARKEFWLPFIHEKLATEDAILIGHSSGAVAIMKYLETHKAKLAILVGACHTDLGDEMERRSGYFDEPWNWNAIKQNAEKIVLFASSDDPYVPLSEALFIKEKLNPEYYQYSDAGHFGADVNKIEFPEIVSVIKEILDLDATTS